MASTNHRGFLSNSKMSRSVASQHAPTAENFAFDDLVFREPVQNSHGGTAVYIDKSATSRNTARVQLPSCRVPFGVSWKNWQGEDVPEGKRKNMEIDLSDPAALAWAQNLDERVIKEAMAHPEWFSGGKKPKKKTLSRELVETLYRPCVQTSKSDPDKYAPTMRIKVDDGAASSHRNTIVRIVTEDDDGNMEYEKGTLRDITRQSDVVAIVKVQGLYFVGRSSFGVTMVASDLLLWKAEEAGEDFPFADLPFQISKKKKKPKSATKTGGRGRSRSRSRSRSPPRYGNGNGAGSMGVHDDGDNDHNLGIPITAGGAE